MKTGICFLMAAVAVASLTTPAFAANDDETSVGGKLNIGVEAQGAITTVGIGQDVKVEMAGGSIARGSHIGGDATINLLLKKAVTTVGIGQGVCAKTHLATVGYAGC